ncbi:MAG: YbhB/YbcL family Raf kinase inhibitor-like protein [SAR202 cluster bacterium]|nr:YbhB/YbcL family Raf kinase inhibitor-like protein [SAR202 cluster bacterium]
MCDSDDVSPELSWSGIPESTKTIAVIMEDPDAPGGAWVHWVVYGISADDGGLPEGVPPSDTLDGGARQGKNDFGRTSYCGPCPPRKGPHRYFFKVYALDADLVLGSGATKAELVREMNGSILGRAN